MQLNHLLIIYKLEREGLLLVGLQVGEGWLLAPWRLALSAQFSSAICLVLSLRAGPVLIVRVL
jgi:hypothetical protein